MRKEFIYNREKEIMEAQFFLLFGQKEEAKRMLSITSYKIVDEILKNISPVSEGTLPYVIAGLRVLADKLEETTEGNWKTTIKFAQEICSHLEISNSIEIHLGHLCKEEAHETNNEES